jgi:hypothetical protein
VFRIINASVYIKERDKMPEEGQIWQDWNVAVSVKVKSSLFLNGSGKWMIPYMHLGKAEDVFNILTYLPV